MSSPLRTLADAVTAAGELWPDGHVEGCEPARLMELNRLLGQARRLLDGAAAQVAAEISRQSRPELGSSSLAKQQGHANANRLLASTLGTSTGEAARLVQVGAAVAPRLLLTGDAAPARHPHVGEALSRGAIGKDAAAAIISMLDGIDHRVGPDDLDHAERILADQAEGLDLDQLRKVLLRAEAHLDPDGIEPKEEELRAQTGLSIRQDRTGMIILNGRFDPERGAPILTLIGAMVTQQLAAQRDEGKTGGKTPGVLATPIPVMQAEALLAICEHYTGCSSTGQSLPGATVIVRVTLDDLQSGTGLGTIDGIDQPVSIGTVRRMAAAGGVIPWVMGAGSEILDWGRRRRLFSPAQKLAITERDGGCIGCGAPPGRAKVHHLTWWSKGGKTDLRDGALACDPCHHRIHDNGWNIQIDGTGTGARVWLIPPATVDPTRTPRPAAKRRYDYVPAA